MAEWVPTPLTSGVLLRDVTDGDLPIFFEQQLGPDTNHMAPFTPKAPADREAFSAHWSRILGDDTIIMKTILFEEGDKFMFRHAIVRPPGANFAQGLTTVEMGAPIFEMALEQHEGYCQALQRSGLALTRLEADLGHPDSTFVEDTAILTGRGAILTRPGAASREGEVASIKDALARFYPSLPAITPPGTLDGGDVCQAGDHFFIGISERTNEDGARQLAGFFAQEEYTSVYIDIRGIGSILHLKSGLAYLGDNRLVSIGALAEHQAFRGYDLVPVDSAESYAANCLRVNETVLLAAGYPLLLGIVRNLGYQVITLEMSEFQKMDGGLSCLSLRF